MSSQLIQAALMSPRRTKHVSADRYILFSQFSLIEHFVDSCWEYKFLYSFTASNYATQSISALRTLVTAMSSKLVQAALMSPRRTKHVSADIYITLSIYLIEHSVDSCWEYTFLYSFTKSNYATLSISALSTLVTAMSSTLIQATLMSPRMTKHVSADRYILRSPFIWLSAL